MWLSPVQVRFIPIADRHADSCFKLCRELKKRGYRAEVDDAGDRMSNKIRKAQKQKIPMMLVVGDAEEEQNGAAIRLRSGEDLGLTQLDGIVAKLEELIKAELPEAPELPEVL